MRKIRSQQFQGIAKKQVNIGAWESIAKTNTSSLLFVFMLQILPYSLSVNTSIWSLEMYVSMLFMQIMFQCTGFMNNSIIYHACQWQVALDQIFVQALLIFISHQFTYLKNQYKDFNVLHKIYGPSVNFVWDVKMFLMITCRTRFLKVFVRSSEIWIQLCKDIH